MATSPDATLGMSDDDFSKLMPPVEAPAAPAADGGAVGEVVIPPVVEAPAAEPAPATEPAPAGEPAPEAKPDAGNVLDKPDGELGDTPPGSGEAKPEGDAAPKLDADGKPIPDEGEGKPAGEVADGAAAEGGAGSSVVELTPDQKIAAFDELMKPFKANGKMIELRDPKEAIALMQMGANYTKRMQDIQPHRKVLMMLQSNGLLDEGKLSFLIDLDKRDPEAIKKLLKDGGIDPMEIDTTSDPAYREGSHRISDDEVQFRSTLDELGSTPTGKETLAEINTGWDQASKEALWKAPEIMSVIHQQREVGVYDVIKAEVDRRITLGAIPANTPFLAAYRSVGDEMAAAALAAENGGKPSGEANGTGNAGVTSPAPAPVVTRVAAPKPAVTNSDRASAASPTKAAPSAVGEVKNPLAMSDDDFIKSMENRV